MTTFQPIRCLFAVTFPIIFSAVLFSQTLPAASAVCKDRAIAQRAAIAFMKAAKTKSVRSFQVALDKHTNMNAISMHALGKYRSKLPSKQRHRFIRLTKYYVARTLTKFALKFTAIEHNIKRCRPGLVIGNLFSLSRGGKKVIWRIKKGRVIDVSIQNVWLVQLLRSNFVSILKKNGGSVLKLIDQIDRFQKLGKADRR